MPKPIEVILLCAFGALFLMIAFMLIDVIAGSLFGHGWNRELGQRIRRWFTWESALDKAERQLDEQLEQKAADLILHYGYFKEDARFEARKRYRQEMREAARAAGIDP